MKIVQALGWYFPDGSGGTEVYVAALCRRLAAAGHDVRVAAPDPGGTQERVYEHDGVSVYRYPIAIPASRAEAQGSVAARGADRFHAWLERQRADVVHMHTFVTGLGLSELRVARRLGARIVATTHSSSLGFLCARGTLMRWGRDLCDGVAEPTTCAACLLQARGVPRPVAQAAATATAALTRSGAVEIPGPFGTALSLPALVRANMKRQHELMDLVDVFVVLTAAAREIVAVNGIAMDRLRVNPLGVDMPPNGRHAKADASRPVTFAYVGRYESLKGVEVLAGAIRSIPASVDFCVEFRGPVRSADETRTYERVRAIVGSDPRVRFSDAVEHIDIPDVLRAYDVICCPSLCLEGGPTIALEAHAVGVPVVGSRIGGLAEIVTDGVNGRLLPPGDADALANAIVAIASDRGGTVGRWRAALPMPRTMDDVARDYLALYASA